MNAKPICVVYIPSDIMGDGRRLINMKDCEAMAKNFEETKPDYHWFIFPDNEYERIEFKTFYEKDFTPVHYEELKKIITDSINNTKQ